MVILDVSFDRAPFIILSVQISIVHFSRVKNVALFFLVSLGSAYLSFFCSCRAVLTSYMQDT